MNNWYIIITQEFAESMVDAINFNSRFNYAITTLGQYVTAYGSLTDFPEQLSTFANGEPLQLVNLTLADFPQPE